MKSVFDARRFASLGARVGCYPAHRRADARVARYFDAESTNASSTKLGVMQSAEKRPRYALIDCEDDARWHGLAQCIVKLFGRDDEIWHHYRACDGELPSKEMFATYDGVVVSGSSHKAEWDTNGTPRWTRALGEWLRRATDDRHPEYTRDADGGKKKVKILAMTFAGYLCALANGGAVGMIPNGGHVVGATAMKTTEAWRRSKAFVKARETYGEPMDGKGETLVVHQNRAQRIERLPEGATATTTSGDGEIEMWTTRDGRCLAWQHSFSDGVASVLSHKVESGLEARRSEKSAAAAGDVKPDDLPNNDAGFLIGVARAFLRDGALASDEDEEYLRTRRREARETLSWAARRREEIMAARAARGARPGAANAKRDAANDGSTATAIVEREESARTQAMAARAFTKIADTVNAELSLAASEVRFLQNANETAAREYDAVGESIADLHVFIGALKAKDEAMKPKLDAILAIEGEVDALETLARAVDKRVSALELRLKSIKSKRASAT